MTSSAPAAAATVGAGSGPASTTPILIGVGVVAVGVVAYYVMKGSKPKESALKKFAENTKYVAKEAFRTSSSAKIGGEEAAEQAIDEFKSGHIKEGIAHAAASAFDLTAVSDFLKIGNKDTSTDNKIFHGIEAGLRVFPPTAMFATIGGWLLPGAREVPPSKLAAICRASYENGIFQNGSDIIKQRWAEGIRNYPPPMSRFKWLPTEDARDYRLTAICTARDEDFKYYADRVGASNSDSPKNSLGEAWPSREFPINLDYMYDPQNYIKKLMNERYKYVEESKLSSGYWIHAGEVVADKLKSLWPF